MKHLALFLLAFAPFLAFAQQSKLQVWTDAELKFTADGKTVTYMTVYEKNPDVDYTAFNMEFTLPRGFRINLVKKGREWVKDISLSVRASSTHTINCNMPDPTLLKIISTSSQNENYYPDDEDGNECTELFTIGLVADPETYNGTYAIQMDGARFVKKDASGISADDLDHVEYSNVTVSGGTDFPGVTYTLPSQGIGTLIVPFNFVPQPGFEVYDCTGLDGSTLQLEKVVEAKANTPYIVRGTPGTYNLNGNYCGLKDSYSTPFLTGVYVDTQVPDGAYVMQDQKVNGLGFYQVAKGQNITISPYRCYLNAQKMAMSRLQFGFGEATGVDEVAGEGLECVDVYSVSGILLRSKVKAADALKGLQPGVYVVNNKRVTVR